jgi:DNA polymerase III gamma/tau subunit
MLNHDDNKTNPTAKTLIALATERYEAACEKMRACAERLRKEVIRNGPMVDLYEMDFEAAWSAHETAADDLREIRDGYRYTYPHPVALVPHGRRYPVR